MKWINERWIKLDWILAKSCRRNPDAICKSICEGGDALVSYVLSNDLNWEVCRFQQIFSSVKASQN